jgi:hypothetical protein
LPSVAEVKTLAFPPAQQIDMSSLAAPGQTAHNRLEETRGAAFKGPFIGERLTLVLGNHENGYTGDDEARIANLRGLRKWGHSASNLTRSFQ